MSAGQDKGNAAGESYNFEMKMYVPASTSLHKMFKGTVSHRHTNGDAYYTDFASNFIGNTDAIDGIRFRVGTADTITFAGRISLYGLSHT
jgi:hypothetical protein